MPEPRFNGEIVAGSLMVNESRKIADLLLQGLDEKAFYAALLMDNVLQKRSPATTRRQSKLIRNRLLPLHEDFWIMIRDGSHEQAVQTLLAAAIMHSRILGDFIRNVVNLQLKTFQSQVTYREWDAYFEECKQIDPTVVEWSDSTIKKIRQVVFRILAEAKIIDSTRNLKIIHFSLLPEVKNLLDNDALRYTRECLEAIQ
ncbi:DUF1819 family protein [Solidesulfovibrio magneticus]|uniref:DUF1819 family protein n=1 Tax=Solidesulfovibrio magneticus TaxID=184917 RepID=UPI0005B821A2|nr:DUF1819 family protein [Solidesulfovibrio magneticus]